MAGWRVRGGSGSSGDSGGVIVNIEPLDYAKLAEAITTGLVAAMRECGQCTPGPAPDPDPDPVILCGVTTEAGVPVLNSTDAYVIAGCCSFVVDNAGVQITNSAGALVYASTCVEELTTLVGQVVNAVGTAVVTEAGQPIIVLAKVTTNAGSILLDEHGAITVVGV